MNPADHELVKSFPPMQSIGEIQGMISTSSSSPESEPKPEPEPEPEQRLCPQCGVPYRSLLLGKQWFNNPFCDCRDRAERARLTKEWEEEERDRRLREAGLGARWRQCSFQQYELNEGNRLALERCRDYAQQWPQQAHLREGSGLLLSGSTGVGKSHLAAAVVLALLERGAKVLFRNTSAFLCRLKDGYAEDRSERGEMDCLEAAELLVLDDLGVERDSPWERETLYRVVNGRYEQLKPIIVTTNADLNLLEKSLGPRTFGRLIEMCLPLLVRGEDHRRKSSRQRKDG